MKRDASDKRLPAFWRGIKPGDFIAFKDAQTLLGNMQGEPSEKLGDLQVRLVRRLTELDGAAEWILIYLDTPQKLVLFATIVENLVSLRLMFQPKGFVTGNRRQIIDRGDHEWLFIAPENQDDFSPNGLRYTDGSIDVPLPTGTGKASYGYKGQEFSCAVLERPKRTGTKQLIATVAEYGAPDLGLANPELMVVEIGEAEKEDGGLIALHVGAAIEFADADVVRC